MQRRFDEAIETIVAHCERLVELKNRYDATNCFRHHQNIAPSV